MNKNEFQKNKYYRLILDKKTMTTVYNAKVVKETAEFIEILDAKRNTSVKINKSSIIEAILLKNKPEGYYDSIRRYS